MSDRFVSCDWGTSSFRLRLVKSGNVVSEVKTRHGIRALNESLAAGDDRDAAFGGYLSEQLGKLTSARLPVVLSGMASATIGWRELPYAKAPLRLDGSNLVHDCIAVAAAASVHLISGACTNQDIMRGEETEAVGILNHDDYSKFADRCLLLLPGTHSKHLIVVDSCIVGWQTFMTGEIFEALTSATILKQTTDAPDESPSDAFLDGVGEGFSKGMEGSVFHARVRGVLEGATNGANRGFLSGLLIGSELRYIAQSAEDRPVLIAGPTSLAAKYRSAMEACEAFPDLVPVDLPNGSAAILGHAFLLKQWLSEGES
jgi:2-dehydro-3-deoxygalactonokinase